MSSPFDELTLEQVRAEYGEGVARVVGYGGHREGEEKQAFNWVLRWKADEPTITRRQVEEAIARDAEQRLEGPSWSFGSQMDVATGDFLDHLGDLHAVQRTPGEPDADFRARILKARGH